MSSLSLSLCGYSLPYLIKHFAYDGFFISFSVYYQKAFFFFFLILFSSFSILMLCEILPQMASMEYYVCATELVTSFLSCFSFPGCFFDISPCNEALQVSGDF
jgi:hypothetical protein